MGTMGAVGPVSGSGVGQMVVGGFNQTKKNLPTLKKITDHKKSYVSPYSFKAI